MRPNVASRRAAHSSGAALIAASYVLATVLLASGAEAPRIVEPFILHESNPARLGPAQQALQSYFSERMELFLRRASNGKMDLDTHYIEFANRNLPSNSSQLPYVPVWVEREGNGIVFRARVLLAFPETHGPYTGWCEDLLAATSLAVASYSGPFKEFIRATRFWLPPPAVPVHTTVYFDDIAKEWSLGTSRSTPYACPRR